MAEVIYKRISDLDSAAQPLGGTELAEISQGGVSKKVTLTSIFGSGWWAALRAAFTSFVAPEATHAVDSDTLVGEAPADFHNAAQLTGAVPLASIPAELTGKNAESVGGILIKHIETTVNISSTSVAVIGSTPHGIASGSSKILGVCFSINRQSPPVQSYIDGTGSLLSLNPVFNDTSVYLNHKSGDSFGEIAGSNMVIKYIIFYTA